MRLERILVLDGDGQIQYIGEDMLKYVNRKLPEPVAYPPEKLERYDKVLIFIRDCSSLLPKNKELVERQINRQLPGKGRALLLFKSDSFLFPLTAFEEENKREMKSVKRPVYIDTVFDHHRISVQNRDGLLEINIDGQKISDSYEEVESFIVIFNESGIKFFRRNCLKTDEDFLEGVLRGVPFSGWYNSTAVNEKKIGVSLFDRDFAELLSEVKDAPRVLKYRNKEYIFCRRGLKLGNRFFTVFQVNGKKQLYRDIRKIGEEYMELCSRSFADRSQEPFSLNFSFFGNDEQIGRVKHLVQKSCRTNMTILLTGESGTGKTTMARNIHLSSKRQKKPFISVNCAAISYTLIESELFGYDEGSFTGARKGGKKGYFELADGGTLFLDEISEIPYALQGKLLEAIQTGYFFRVGGERKVHSDFRLIAATNRNLKQMVEDHSFREDLFYRINVFPVELPPLRERADSLHYIISDLLPAICSRLDIEPVTVSLQAMEKMRRYSWPGNIRELENVLEKAAVLCSDNFILAEDIDLPKQHGELSERLTLKEAKERLEKEMILRVLKEKRGERTAAAEALGIGRTSLFEKMKKYGIEQKEAGENNAVR